MPRNSSGARTPDQLLNIVRRQYPDVAFTSGATFRWSPKDKTIEYDAAKLSLAPGQWALLHETGHAALDHTDYGSDFELLTMEVAAWEHAKTFAASELDEHIDPGHIEDCLDTYRDWLHRRSTCPTCGSVSLQQSSDTYHCHNCLASWHVTAERFCRPYRRIAK